MSTFLSKIFEAFLNWLVGKLTGWLEAREQKRRDDAAVDEPVKVIETGTDGDGLDAVEDLEDLTNANAPRR
jgi:hypothetical protein